MKDDFATLATCPGTDVHDPVGTAHHVLIVFDDDDRITQIAQFLEGADEAFVVALVQADAGLVEDIEHVHQLRSDLRGETDALALTTREAG